MASEMIVHEDHKAAINEMMEKLEKEVVLGTDDRVNALMLNQTLGEQADRFLLKSWEGRPTVMYPETIPRDRMGAFTHAAIDAYGTKGCVMYTGSVVQGGSNDWAWVLAWSVNSSGTAGNRVYVEVKPKDTYTSDGFRWYTIEDKLRASGSESYYRDNATGARVSATIGTGNDALISAVFDIDRSI